MTLILHHGTTSGRPYCGAKGHFLQAEKIEFVNCKRCLRALERWRRSFDAAKAEYEEYATQNAERLLRGLNHE